MLDEPCQFRGLAGPDGGDPRLHGRDRLRIGNKALADHPVGGLAGRGQHRGREIGSNVEHGYRRFGEKG